MPSTITKAFQTFKPFYLDSNKNFSIQKGKKVGTVKKQPGEVNEKGDQVQSSNDKELPSTSSFVLLSLADFSKSGAEMYKNKSGTYWHQ